MRMLFCFIAVIQFLLISCDNNTSKNKYVSNTNETGMYLTSEDTAIVKSLVNQFMNFYKDEKYADAAGMLYLQKNPKTEPLLLDNNELQDIMLMLRNNPIKSFVISKIDFKDAENNLVECNIIRANGMLLNFYFSPIRYLGGWRLCIKNEN